MSRLASSATWVVAVCRNCFRVGCCSSLASQHHPLMRARLLTEASSSQQSPALAIWSWDPKASAEMLLQAAALRPTPNRTKTCTFSVPFSRSNVVETGKRYSRLAARPRSPAGEGSSALCDRPDRDPTEAERQPSGRRTRGQDRLAARAPKGVVCQRGDDRFA